MSAILSSSGATASPASVADLATPADKADPSQFLSLLNTSIANQFSAASVAAASASSQDQAASTAFFSAKSEFATIKADFAAPPSQFASSQPQARTSDNSISQQPQAAAPQSAAVIPEKSSRDTQSSSPAPSLVSSPSHESQNANTDQSPPSQPATHATASSANQTSDSQQSQKDLRSALRGQLQTIDQILSSLIQYFSPASSLAKTVTASSGSGTSAADATAAATLLASQVAGQLLPVQAPLAAVSTATTNVTAGLSNELSLLKDLQDLVDQLKQSLQGSDTPAPVTVSSAASGAATPVIADNTVPDAFLQQAMSQLSQLLAGQKSSASGAAGGSASVTKPTVATGNATQAAPTDSTGLVSFIKSSIAGVRDQLQSLNRQNEAIFSQVQNSAQALGVNPKQLFNDTLSANNSPLVVSYSAANIQAQPVTVQTGINAQLQAFAAASFSLTPQSGDSSANSNSDGQSQPQAQAIMQPAATAPQTSATTTGASFSKLLDQQTHTPLLDQVAFQVKTAVTDGSSKISIQLHPADLGKMEINLSVDASGKTSVSVSADNHHTLELLQRDSDGLSRALSDAGLKTDSGSLSFNLSNGGQQQGRESGQSNVAQPVATYQKTQPDDTQESNLAVLTRSYVVTVADGLDIQI